MAEVEEISDVVIIINDDDSNLKDLLYDEPSCLIPLVNIPIIHYLMIQLLSGNMKNFIIFAGQHRKSIKKLFKEARYKDYVNNSLHFDFIDDEGICTVGDAMRYLHDKKFERDFVLLHGDTLINCNVTELVKRHQEATVQNMIILLTKVVSLKHDTFSKSCDLLNYDVDHNILSKDGTSLNKYTDSQIYICSKRVIFSFNENTEFNTMEDVIDNVLAHSTVINDAVQVIPLESLCVRIQTLNTYFYASSRIIKCSICRSSPTYIFGDNIRTVSSSGQIISTHQSSYLSARLPKNFMDGSSRFIGTVEVMYGCTIGRNSRLIDTILGKNCVIGSNVILKNCVLMDGVTVDNNCLISDTFIGKNAHIEEQCQITDKCIIDGGFRVSARLKTHGQCLSEREIVNIWDIGIDNINLMKNVSEQNDGDIETDEDDNFDCDMHDLLKQALEEKILFDNLRIDTKNLQSTYDKDMEDMCIDLCNVFVKYPLKEPSNEKYGIALKKLFDKYGKLIAYFVADEKNRKHSCLVAIEECACNDEVLLQKVSDIVVCMYASDIVDVQDIRDWFDTSVLLDDDDVREKAMKVRDNVANFLEQLEASDDESDE